MEGGNFTLKENEVSFRLVKTGALETSNRNVELKRPDRMELKDLGVRV